MKRNIASRLAIVIDGNHCGAGFGSGAAWQYVHRALAVEPLCADPSLVAQELRELLAPLAPLPRRLCLGLPLDRLLCLSVDLPPEMPAEMIQSYLQLQAEQQLLLSPAEMAFVASLSTTSAAACRRATLLALPLPQFENLRRAARLLGFKQVQITALTLPLALAGATAGDGADATLLAGPRWIDFVVSNGQAVALLRRVAGAATGPRPQPDFAAVGGELRLSLGQLPADVRQQLQQIRIIGSNDAVHSVQTQLLGSRFAGIDGVGAPLPPEQSVLQHAVMAMVEAGAASIAALALAPIEQASTRHRWRQLQRRQLLSIAAVLLLAGVVGVVLLLQQHRKLHNLQASWAQVQPRAAAVRTILAELKQQEPWLNDHPLHLDIFKTVTQAFPEAADVWTTRLEIRDRLHVSLVGNARSREAWLKMLDDLRQRPGVHDLRVLQARESADGKSPMTFSLSFAWRPPPVPLRQSLEVTP